MNIVWTPANISRLERLRADKKKWAEIAAQMETTVGAVRSAYNLHVKGRPPRKGNRRDYNREWMQKNKEKFNAARREKRAAAKG